MATNWYYSEGFSESFNKDYQTSPTAFNRDRSSYAGFSRTLDQTYNAVLNYEKQFNEHYLAVMLGS